jgi:membrane protease YdiL (CAAX protease family)
MGESAMSRRQPNLSQPSSPETNRVKAALRGGGWVGFLVLIFILAVTYCFGPPVGGPVVLLWAWWTGLPWRDLGFRRPKSWALLITGGIIAGVVEKLFSKTVMMPLLHAPDINAHYQFLVHNTHALWQMLFTSVVFAGFFEEVIARGFLFERLGKFIGTSRGALVATILFTSALFGAAHYPEQSWMGVEQAGIFAIVEGIIFVATRQLWFLVVMHAAFDIVACLIIYFGLETQLAHLFFH